MQAFLVELGRFLLTLWGNLYRWALRKRRNLVITFAGAVVLFIAGAAIVNSGTGETVAKPTPTPTPTSTVVYTDVTATPVTGGEGSATEEPTPAPEASASDATADEDQAESVARQWAMDYLERESAEDTTWKDAMGEYTIASVVEQLDAQAFRPEGIMDGQAPTTVTDVVIADPAADAETNTPVRWSHNVIVTVQGQDGTAKTITFGLVLMAGDGGWSVTSVSEISVEG